MRWKRKRTVCSTAIILLVTASFGGFAQAQWPERPITLVVMYAPGGGTDTVLRTLAAEMSNARGWRINVVNRPGAAGTLATNFVRNRPNDGYTLLGSSSFGKFARVSGDGQSKSWRDWYFMQAATNLASWSVRPVSPYQTFADVVAAARANPGQITISTSGSGGIWHEMAASVAKAAGIELKYVPYGSGQAATLAGLNGEVDVAGGGVHEHIQFVDSGDLVPLQQTGARDILTNSGKTMPSLVNFVPGIREQLPPNGTYDIGIRRDTPIEIVRQVQAAFLAAVDSEAFRALVEQQRLFIEVKVGESADRRAAELESITATMFQDLGIPGARTAEELGLPAAEAFDEWWPPEDYEPLPLY
jgi:tripartite-type tricarboxylate transporter receptor subunit TctC